MAERRKQVRILLACILVLFTVSLYRQISLCLWPADPFRTYILYACYLGLIGGWIFSIHCRITSRSMRFFLTAVALFMLFGLTIRFLQDTFWQEDLALNRFSGLMLLASLLPMLTMGLFASLGLGREDSYRIPGGWYFMLLPAAVLTVLSMMDEQIHFMFYVIPEEPQPNLSFHPGPGTFLVLVLALLTMGLRITLIYRRNRSFTQSRWLRIFIPFFEPALTILFTMDYFVVSLGIIPALRGMEVIELYAKIYLIEALTWEFYIYAGLVPVNVEYRKVFEHATVGMQILEKNGTRLRSATAERVTEEQIRRLEKESCLTTETGTEIHAFHLDQGTFLWNRDVSHLRDTIERLHQEKEILEREGSLLEEEWRAKRKEARLAAQNQVNDDVIRDVLPQLDMLKKTAAEIEPEKNEGAHAAPSELRERAGRLHRLILLGTYIKRRCNLALIQKESGEAADLSRDLMISLRDLTEAMLRTGISAALIQEGRLSCSGLFALYLFDMTEYLLERADLSPDRVETVLRSDSARITVHGHFDREPAELEALAPQPPEGSGAAWQHMKNQVRVILTEGGDPRGL